MTMIRKLALKIATIVVRYASPGCKQWAEGLLQETDHIENDWSALEWALGSTRVLLDRREAPVRSMAEAMAVAHKFVAAKRQEMSSSLGKSVWVIVISIAVGNGLKLFDTTSWLQRVGCVDYVVAATVWLVSTLIETKRLGTLLKF
jgi:RecA-family ATPase